MESILLQHIIFQRYTNLVVNIARESGQEWCECGTCGCAPAAEKILAVTKNFDTRGMYG